MAQLGSQPSDDREIAVGRRKNDVDLPLVAKTSQGALERVALRYRRYDDVGIRFESIRIVAQAVGDHGAGTESLQGPQHRQTLESAAGDHEPGNHDIEASM